MELYYVNLSPFAADELRQAALACLPARRREKALSMRNVPAQNACIGAGLLLTYGLRRMGENPDPPIELLPAGKPVLAGRDDLWFSLSHSGPYALCALSRMPVGADIQGFRPWKDGIVRRFCPDEQAWLAGLPETERRGAFFRLWTRKESWVKAVSHERVLPLNEQSVLHDFPPWHFADFALSDHTAAAVCTREPEVPGRPKELSIQELLERSQNVK